MSHSVQHTIIIGGVAAGMSAATRLRRNDESARITVFERGEYVSFANCGLPYHVSGVIEERDALLLQTPQSLRARFNIDVQVGHEVTAIDPANKTVTVKSAAGEQHHAFDHLVIATGAAPRKLPVDGIDRALVLRDVPDLDKMKQIVDGKAGPGSAVIIGAGYIGVEVAENLLHLGWETHIVDVADQVFTPLDAEMAQPVEDALRGAGAHLHLSTSAASIDETHVQLASGQRLAADLVVLAAGVQPESRLAVDAGIEVHERGGILVDEAQRTSADDVYAVGDVAVKRDWVSGDDVLVPLAQTANRHGRLVADVIVGRAVSAAPVLGTAIVSACGVTAASTGWTERRAVAAGRSIDVIHTHPADHAGYYPGAEGMSLKLVVDRDTQEILGAQGVGGAGVDKRIDIIATAMKGGLTAPDLADLELAYAPQFGSAKDPVNMLGMVADNLATGVMETVQWHEVADCERDGWTLLDVRTAGEHAAGTIPGAVNIEVDALRDAAQGLDPSGKYLVFCQVGMRGNVATRLLTGLGLTAHNLDGGFLTWQRGRRTR